MHSAQGTTKSVRGLLAALCCVVGAEFASAQQGPLTLSSIVRDGSLPGSVTAGPVDDGGTGLFEIGEADGHRPGGSLGVNLLQSLSILEVADGDTLRFSADQSLTTKNVIVRVWERPSRVEGRLESVIDDADFYLLSPQGVFFGEDAQLDVPGSLYVSTADSLEFDADGVTQQFEARKGGSVPTFSMASPESFGFLGNAKQRIVFDSSVVCGAGFSRACGGATVDGAFSLQAGGVDLMGGTAILSNSQDVEIVATDSISLSGQDAGDERGSMIFLSNGDHETGSDIALSADRILLSDGAALEVNNHGGRTSAGGEIRLQADRLIRLHGSDEKNEALGPLTLLPQGNPDTNQLEATLQRGSVDILTIGSDVQGSEGTGAITLEAPTVEILDGAEVTTYALGAAAGDITLIASSRLELSGVGGDAQGSGSVVQSRNPGFNEAGTAGDVIVRAGEVQIRDGGMLATNTAGKGNAGSIQIAARQITLDEGAQLSSESTGTLAVLDAEPGKAGEVEVSADTLTLSGRSEISVFTEEGPEVPEGLVSGEPSPAGLVRGNIDLQTRDLLLLEEESRIEASVGSGLGGSVTIGGQKAATTGVVLRERSAIFAQARGSADPGDPVYTPPTDPGSTPQARGGDIEIHAKSVLACPDCEINADGPTQGSQGSVVINEPGTAIESQVVAPAVAYLDASSLLLAKCGAAQGSDLAGRFSVARWPGRTLSPEGPLLAMAPLGVGFPRTRAASRAGEADTDSPFSGDEAQGSIQVALRAASETLRGGRVDRAGADFRTLQERAAAAGDPAGESDALRGLGQSRQAFGAYEDSLAPLEQALALARGTGDLAREAAALGDLGNAYVALGDYKTAETTLTRAVEVARGASMGASPGTSSKAPNPFASPGLTAALLNNLGNQRAIAGNSAAALDAYAQSAEQARGASEWLRVAQAEANAARSALQLSRSDASHAHLERARDALNDVERGSREETALRIHLAYSEIALARQDPDDRHEALLRAYTDLRAASRAAEAAGDLRSASHALGNLGTLYAEEGGRDREAMALTHRALQIAERAQAADLLARWHAQSGRLAWRANQVNAALDAYRRAVQLLEETRPEAGAAYGDADFAFRRWVEPVYLALVDLLLRSSGAREAGDGIQPEPAESDLSQARLAEAREVVEAWKAAELRNYFRDGCAAEFRALSRSVEDVDPHAAIIYPIALADRLELLVSHGSEIARYTLPVERVRLEEEVRRFLSLLSRRTTREYEGPARQLYSWLVSPFEASLDPTTIDTLVFVPGGALRTVPMAALHDGERFLMERYAVAVTPSLDLMDPVPIEPGESKLLLAGLSKAVQGYPALPNVPDELAAIQRLYGGEILLDDSFQTETLENSLRESRPGVVHIASHAEFSGDPSESFVLTHDGSLSMEDFSSLLRSSRGGQEPVELLMLSACETAAGDERAALGLAGMAIRAGARSSMGSLWSVSDQATSALVVGFYEALDTPGTSKARALQKAQEILLADARFRHPYFWAPFLVINNWL